jgi:ribulose-bisphosphate carboxylase large chain
MKNFKKEIDAESYIIVDYFLESLTSLRDAAWNLAIGQSVGNPNIRNNWETDELFENHSCIILEEEGKLKETKYGNVSIAFPVANIDIDTDGITQLLVQIMGGQLDIDNIVKCHVLNITLPECIKQKFKRPRFGIKGIREFTGVYNKPILGAIVKPKIGISPEILLELVKELVDGGVNFIKEDEIMSNPLICPIEKRVPLIMDYLKDKKVIYSVCINSDTSYILERAKKVYELGGNSVHVNFWAGLGSYKSIRELDLPLFLFFQKSGDKILTNKKHDFHIEWNVICKLASYCGIDFIHAGMWGGYMESNEKELKTTIDLLNSMDVIPSLSCGMHCGLVDAINKRFGIDYMANCGGSIHGHPMGTKSGALAMRQSIDKDYREEYSLGIKKWGLIQ